MSYEQRPGSGSLFRNEFKKEGENTPDYRGKIADLNGVEHNIAGWVKQTKTGKPFLSLKLTVVTGEEQPEAKAQQSDDLPF